MFTPITSKWWVDIMEEQETARLSRFLRLSAAEWKEEKRRMITGWKGDLKNFITLADRVDALRRTVEMEQAPAAPAVPRTEFDVDFGLWKEMIENPEPYGDDIVEWLPLDEKLSAGPGRWRLGAYWVKYEEEIARREEIARQNAMALLEKQAATVIQAAVRGHQLRSHMVTRDCCMCLAHRICPLKTDVGYMCRECAAEGPHVDHTGPLSDPWDWFRADYEEDEKRCRWCPAPAAKGSAFCDLDCEIDYKRKSWKLDRY